MLRSITVFLTAILLSCSGSYRTSPDMLGGTASPDNDVVDVTLLHLNDVYEIAPVENGQFGGMARVATIRKELKRENPNTFTFLAGDFISPSAIGTSTYQGKRINGAQMIAAMNSVGVDYVTFGNHEFDLGYEALQQRLNESAFTWISSNVHYTPSQEGEVKPFWKTVQGGERPLPEYVILRAKNAAGVEVRIGVFALTIGSNTPPYVVWSNPFETARRMYDLLQPQTDMVIALTHLSLEEDRTLAAMLPGVRMILGGHEHTNMMFKVGETLIAKADANARTVYIHRLQWSASKRSLVVRSEVKTVDGSVPEDSATAAVVKIWRQRAYDGFRAKGFEPDEVVTTLRQPLDGRESSIRTRQTNLGATIARAMVSAARKAEIAVFNSGSIRLDDELSGTVTQYDVIRTLPFGGKILEVEMRGRLLQRVLNAGMRNVGRGGYLQYHGVEVQSAADPCKQSEPIWLSSGKPIDPGGSYWVIVSDYLFSGQEQGIEFFKNDNPDVLSVDAPSVQDESDPRRDIRLAVIRYLKR